MLNGCNYIFQYRSVRDAVTMLITPYYLMVSFFMSWYCRQGLLTALTAFSAMDVNVFVPLSRPTNSLNYKNKGYLVWIYLTFWSFAQKYKNVQIWISSINKCKHFIKQNFSLSYHHGSHYIGNVNWITLKINWLISLCWEQSS